MRWLPSSELPARLAASAVVLAQRARRATATRRGVVILGTLVLLVALALAGIGRDAALGPGLSGLDPAGASGGWAGTGHLASSGESTLDLVALGSKAVLVLVLLVITLQVLRRAQRGRQPTDARLIVLESRTLGPKATLHLVAVGERRLVIGLSPGGLVALAELNADELAEPNSARLAPDGTAAAGAVAVGAPAGRNFQAVLATLTDRTNRATHTSRSERAR